MHIFALFGTNMTVSFRKSTQNMENSRPMGGCFDLLDCVGFLVQLHIAEVQEHIDGDLDKVQEVECPAKEKDPAVAAVGKENKILCDAENIADPDEDLELQ